MTAIKSARKQLLIFGALYVVFGALFIIIPQILRPITVLAIAGLALAMAAVKIVGYFLNSNKNIVKGGISVGLILLIAAVFLVIKRDEFATSLLYYVLGFVVLFCGCFLVQSSLDMRAAGSNKWLIVLGLSVLCVTGGALALFIIFSKDPLVHLRVVGGLLAFDGACSIAAFFLLNDLVRGAEAPQQIVVTE